MVIITLVLEEPILLEEQATFQMRRPEPLRLQERELQVRPHLPMLQFNTVNATNAVVQVTYSQRAQ